MNILNDPKVRLDFAISHFGNKSSLAKALNLSRVTVTDWVNKNKYVYVPAIHAYRLIRNYPDVFDEELPCLLSKS